MPKDRRALAALGPRVLRLARDRTAGALPYLTTAEHTRQAREILGPGALLVPEHKIVLDTDAERARQTARPRVEFYLNLQNYVSNLRRLHRRPGGRRAGRPSRGSRVGRSQERTRRAIASVASLILASASGPPCTAASTTQWLM